MMYVKISKDTPEINVHIEDVFFECNLNQMVYDFTRGITTETNVLGCVSSIEFPKTFGKIENDKILSQTLMVLSTGWKNQLNAAGKFLVDYQPAEISISGYDTGKKITYTTRRDLKPVGAVFSFYYHCDKYFLILDKGKVKEIQNRCHEDFNHSGRFTELDAKEFEKHAIKVGKASWKKMKENFGTINKMFVK